MKKIFTIMLLAASAVTYGQNFGTAVGYTGPVVKKQTPTTTKVKQVVAPTSTGCKPSVLLCVASGYAPEVVTRLTSTGMFSSVTIFDMGSGNPSVSYLSGFDAVMVFTDGGASDTAGAGNNIGAYINAGGGVVSTTFDDASVPIGGLYNTAAYRVLIPASQTQSTVRTLGTVLLPNHPMMNGVSSFNGGSSSYKSTSTTLSPGAYRIANYDDGTPLLTAKENVGTMNMRRADLDFYPPSEGSRSDFWDTLTDGDQIMVNALYWVCKSSLSETNDTMCITAPPFALTTGYPSGGTYSGVGVSGNTFNPATAGPGNHTIYYIHTMLSGCVDTAMQTIVVNACQGVEETLDVNAVNIHPNPSHGLFSVDIASPGLKEISLSLLDVEGRVVYTTSQQVSGSYNKELDLTRLANGVYSLQVVSNLGIVTKKVVIQN